MPRAHGVEFPLAQGGCQFLEMHFNSWIRVGCSRERAKNPLVLSIPFSPDSQFIKEIPEHMMYLNALGQSFLVFNSLKPASELLDRRARISSDRPRLIVGNEILCGGLFTPLIPYGDVSVCPYFLKVRNSHFCF